MPGFLIGENGIIASRKYRHFDKFNFDEVGFLDTVEWLESSSNYEYSEDTEMILLPYHITDQDSHEPICDLEHLQSYNLDTLLKDGINLHKFIKEAVKVVQQNMTYDETRRLMDGVLENVKNLKSHKVFIAGAKALDRERDGIRSVLSQLSNRGDIIFQTWTFEDFDRSFTKDGRQCDYDSFIRESADSVVFVLDERIGGITLSEFDIAIDSSYNNSSRGVARVVAWKYGFSATGYDSNPVCTYTDDHYATFMEYNNLGGWNKRFDAQQMFTLVNWKNAVNLIQY